MLANHICALDLSSSKIAAVVARLKGRRIDQLFFDTAPSKGIERGSIVNSVDLTSALSVFLKNLKARSGINIKFIYANICGQDIITKHSRAVIPLTERGNKVITPSDIERVNEQARILGSSLEEEIIQALPFSYSIDSKDNIANPLGLYSHRLESDLYLICAKLPAVQALNRVVSQSGYEIRDLFFSGIATALAVMGRDFKEGINVLCDIGCDITQLLVFKDGSLRNIEILPLGGDDLTAQLAEALKIPPELAEELKKSSASVTDYTQIKEDKEIMIKRNNVYKSIRQKLVSEIVTSKARLLCQDIKGSLERLVCRDEINNFIAVGRTVILEGLLEELENALEVRVKLGRVIHPDLISLINKYDATSGQKYLTYTTALGIICQAMEEHPPRIIPFSHPGRNPILKAINRVKEVYQEYF
jgi:cell division protein FtsA